MVAKRQFLGPLVLLVVLGVTSGFASAPEAGAPSAPAWEQVNVSGFGDPKAVGVTALEVFNGNLYAGIANPTGGTRIYRSPDGTAWAPVSQAGFGIVTDTRPLAIMDLAVFRGQLYASTGRNENAGQIWRTGNGTTWAPMVIAGFSDPDTVDITALAEYNGTLYAGATNRITGAQIWRSASGDSNTWTQDDLAVLGNNRAAVTGFAVYGGSLYAAVEPGGPVQVWRTTGSGWTPVVTDGFGTTGPGGVSTATGGMAGFGGYLYVGAGNQTAGAQLWRTNDGANWEQIITPGFGNPGNEVAELVFVFQGQLYAGVTNSKTGMELWRASGGGGWEQINADGFGDSNNAGASGSNALAAFSNLLYVGTSNAVDGGEVWRMLTQGRPTYLPLVRR